MEINKIREMSTPELEKEVLELKKELFKLNFALAKSKKNQRCKERHSKN